MPTVWPKVTPAQPQPTERIRADKATVGRVVIEPAPVVTPSRVQVTVQPAIVPPQRNLDPKDVPKPSETPRGPDDPTPTPVV